MENGGLLKIFIEKDDVAVEGMDMSIPDNRILASGGVDVQF